MQYNHQHSNRCTYREITMLKITNLLQSRKFWALVASAVAIIGAWQTGGMAGNDAANTLVAALAAYSIATGIEDSGQG